MDAPAPRMRFRDILPKGLYWRTLLIIVAPAALLQLIITLVFLDDHWQATSKRMSQGVAADVALIIQLYERDPTQENFGPRARAPPLRLDIELQCASRYHALPRRASPDRYLRAP
jgi:two-component system osmolarity sensor histidine kinase EnvZ